MFAASCIVQTYTQQNPETIVKALDHCLWTKIDAELLINQKLNLLIRCRTSESQFFSLDEDNNK